MAFARPGFVVGTIPQIRYDVNQFGAALVNARHIVELGVWYVAFVELLARSHRPTGSEAADTEAHQSQHGDTEEDVGGFVGGRDARLDDLVIQPLQLRVADPEVSHLFKEGSSLVTPGGPLDAIGEIYGQGAAILRIFNSHHAARGNGGCYIGQGDRLVLWLRP